MVQIQNIAIAAAVGAATYATASPIEQSETLEARHWGQWQQQFKCVFDKKASAWAPVAPWNHASLPSATYGCNAPGIPKWTGGDKAKCWLWWNKWSAFCQKGNQPKPQPGTGGGNNPAPGTGGNNPAPGTGGNTPAPGTGGNTPAPGDGGNTPAPGDGGNTPAPGDGGNTPAPGDGGNTPAPGTGGDGTVCNSKYQQVFNNYQTVADSGVYQGQTVGAATVDNANYMTYILVDTADKCLTACDQTDGCVFVNLYQDNASQPSDVNELPVSAQSKYYPGNLTCALYKACSGTEKANNYGGQQDPTFITQSSGYCKNGKC